MNDIFCPVCGKGFSKKLYTLGFIHCHPFGCGAFFDIKTKKVLPTNDKNQIVVEAQDE